MQTVRTLVEAVKACQGLLDHPLFLLEAQHYEKKVFRGRRLLLMGDAEPTPDFIELERGLEETKALYLGIKGGAIRLSPFLSWDMVQARGVFGLYLLHDADVKKVEYLTVFDDELARTDVGTEFESLTMGGLRPAEEITLVDGSDLFFDWIQTKKVREKAAQPNFGPIPWNVLSEATLKWYESLLKGSKSPKKPGSMMVKALLDGRDILSIEELNQIVILFGKQKAVSALVKRRSLIVAHASRIQKAMGRAEGTDDQPT